MPRYRRVGAAGRTRRSVVGSANNGSGVERTARFARGCATVEVEGRRFAVTVLEPEPPWAELARRRRRRATAAETPAAARRSSSPMQGTVLAVQVAEGDEVSAGQLVCIIEAMKMENEIHAHRAGHGAAALGRAAGEPVDDGTGHLRRRSLER